MFMVVTVLSSGEWTDVKLLGYFFIMVFQNKPLDECVVVIILNGGPLRKQIKAYTKRFVDP
jgi:hypothetical protein